MTNPARGGLGTREASHAINIGLKKRRGEIRTLLNENRFCEPQSRTRPAQDDLES